MENVSRVRAFSSPELLPLPTSSTDQGPEDHSLEGDCVFFFLFFLPASADQEN